MNRYLTWILVSSFLALSVWSGWEPTSRDVWYIEFTPAAAIFLSFLFMNGKFHFSAMSRILVFAWLCWHTIGAHYTFAGVPFQWFSELFGSTRNHFDRISHFLIGLYAYPIAEWIIRTKHIAFRTALVFSLCIIMSVAAGYEIFEWIYATLDGGDTGIEILGAQGDVWDAQKDMLCDTVGALVSLTLFAGLGRGKRKTQSRQDKQSAATQEP